MLCNSNRADGSEAPSVRAGRFTERLEAKIEDQGESLRTDIRHLDAKIDAQGESLRTELRTLTQSVTAIAIAMANRAPVS